MHSCTLTQQLAQRLSHLVLKKEIVLVHDFITDRLFHFAFLSLYVLQVLTVDDWLHFRAARRVGALVKALRHQVHNLSTCIWL
jgi:hypothetical protein